MHKKRKKDKPYEFFIRFNDAKTSMIVNNELKAYGIDTHYKIDSKKILVDSKNRIESRLIDDVIEGKFKDLKKNELKYRE